YTAPQVVFWMSHDTGYSTNADRIQVQVSTDGVAWVNAGAPVLRYDATCTTACWKEHTVLLPAGYNLNGVYVGFLGVSAYGNNFYLDDTALSEGWYPCPYVSLGPDGSKPGCPGSSVDHGLTLINMSPDADTFDVTVSGNAWTTTPSPTPVALGAGESAAITVTVDVPWAGGSDTANVTALGQTFGWTDSATLTTTGSPTYWASIASEPDNGRMDNVTGAWDGKAWSITGYGANLNVRSYDPATNTWTTVGTPPPFTGNYARSGCQAGSKVFLYGDTSTAGFTGLWSYDMATTTWTAETPGGTPPATTGIWAPAWAYDAETGYCYLTGGATVAGTGNLNTVNVYDPATNAWMAPLPNFTTVRDFHAAWVFTDNTARKLLCVAGGNGGGVGIASTQCYDLVAGTWGAENADMGPLPADLWAMGYAQKVHQGVTQLWMTGGVRAGALTAATSFFDVAAGAWADDGNLATGVAYRGSAVTLDNSIYALGGSIGSFNYTGLANGHVQCPACEPPTNVDFTWSPPNPGVGVPVTFTGSAAGSAPFTYAWDFGDTGTGSGNPVDHSYAAGGDYGASLEVSNFCGIGNASHTVTVTTLTPPDIDVDPLSLSSTLNQGATEQQTLNIGNAGEQDLHWTIVEEPTAGVRGKRPVVMPARRGGGDLGAPARGEAVSRTASSGKFVSPAHYESPADFSEGFDDITLLPGLGWFFQNNSNPLGPTNWFQGNSTVFPAQSGAATSYIGANYNNTAGVGTISNWMLTPEVAMADGDTVSFWTRTVDAPAFPDRLQVRLSTNGASTNVGADENSVGDFTTLLLDINPTLTTGGYPNVWTQYTLTLSGIPPGASGRIGFRYYVTDAGPAGNNSDYIGIDTFEYTAAGGSTACQNPADVPWLSVSPAAGTTVGGGVDPVGVTFDATGLNCGSTYTANLCVESDDPDPGPGNGTSLVVVPVDLTISCEPDIVVDPASLSSLMQPVDTQVVVPMDIMNVGFGDLTWDITEDAG
ncbi:MAG: choice-of-anchor J domain-containing protein, partial [Betaproteobacteria bacterium]